MRGVWLVFKKEVLEFTKDRKTMLITLAMPIILYPLLFGMIGKMGRMEVQRANSNQTRIALVDPSGVLEPLVLERTDDFKIVPVPDGDPKEAIRSEEMEMLVTLNHNAAAEMAEHKTVHIDVLYNSIETSGRIGMQRLEKVIQELDKTTIQTRLQKLGASAQLAEPTKIESMQIGGQELVFAKFLGTMLPYMLMLMLFAGSMQLGIYVTAGERERGTLITLLSTGLPRREIIWGKLLYVFCMGIFISVINMVSMALSAGGIIPSEAKTGMAAEAANEATAQLGLASVADPTVIVLILILMIPLGLMFSNLIIFLGIQAKNIQEAGTSMVPLFLIVIFLAIFSMTPGIEKMALLPYIPIVNVSLVIKKLIAHQASVLEYSIAFFMTVGLAVLLTYLSTIFLNRESALFKST